MSLLDETIKRIIPADKVTREKARETGPTYHAALGARSPDGPGFGSGRYD